MFSAESVCLFVCELVGRCVRGYVCPHDNFQTSKRMMKLGGRCIVQKSRPSSNLGVIDVAFGYNVGKIMRAV